MFKKKSYNVRQKGKSKRLIVFLVNVFRPFLRHIRCLLGVRNHVRIWQKNGEENKAHDFMKVQQKNKKYKLLHLQFSLC